MVTLMMMMMVMMMMIMMMVMVSVRCEYCHDWRDPRAEWRDGFQCPEKTDRRDSVLCCGHCELRYCCGDTRARLDQDTCTDHSRARQPPGNQHTTGVPVYVPFLVVVCVFVAFLLLGSVVAVCYCLSQKPRPQTRPSREAPPPSPEPLPVTSSTGTSCGSSSSLYPLNSNTQTQQQQQQQAPPLSVHQHPNPAFHRTMTLPTMLHPLMFSRSMMNPYMMPTQYPKVFRSAPSPSPPITVQRSSEVIL